jgi:hypothetical protein
MGLTNAWPAILVVLNTVHSETTFTGQLKKEKSNGQESKEEDSKEDHEEEDRQEGKKEDSQEGEIT